MVLKQTIAIGKETKTEKTEERFGALPPSLVPRHWPRISRRLKNHEISKSSPSFRIGPLYPRGARTVVVDRSK